ncbi:hypothetical protein BP5796_10496 [Coleophoma crateriformis]|uniref:HMG box domain-containing protein n=1 Tax=Coleophoma crateriformis TaxID=565419 RepID=A0A3D8QR75_9HELO|nr:hypothetical protein BP5796_10496 [Coleophoma crateriformis]
MTELGEIFAELGISQYLNEFVEQGFDTWDTILDITESDFDALNVKLGHRRKIQRKIAQSRNLSLDRALTSPSRNTPSEDRPADESKISSHRTDGKDGSAVVQGAKRKYRRHPKADDNAPERPPSAYVIFSNKMREDLKGRHLSFTEIAKLVGEHWQNLSPQEREPFEQQASTAKEKYNNELAEYKKTEQYKEYSQYLIEFKTRQAQQQQQQTTDTDNAKRPKLEAHPSTNSNSSGASVSASESWPGRRRVNSAATTGSWPPSGRQLSTPHSPGMLKMNIAHVPVSSPSLQPNATSPTVLPGYRDSQYGDAQQALPWREGQRDETASISRQSPRAMDSADARTSFAGKHQSRSENLNTTGALQHAHRTGDSHPPPSLTSELTSGTTRSSGSSTSTSSSFFNPRTPMEPSGERALPIPSLYPQKSYENQLPPLRATQSSMLGAQSSPHGIPSIMDFPTAMAPMRGHVANTVGGAGQSSLSTNSPEDIPLDPVSALLKAGEIVDRNSRNWRSQMEETRRT